MRAVVLTAARPELTGAELPDPIAAPGEVVLAVTGCGICGSDLHIAAQLAAEGSILGHEIAGRIEAVGRDVDESRWPVGTAVVARPFTGCGACRWCRAGRADHCAQFSLVGLTRPGGFAELVAVRADELFAVPADLSLDDQALVEPLAVAHRVVHRCGLTRGDSVAVLGAGPIGLATVAWASRLGVESITVSDPAPQRRELATALGATTVVDPLTEDLDALVTSGPDGGASVVFECSGRAGLIQQAINLTAVNGRVGVVGICLAEDMIFPYAAISKEIDLRFAIYYERDDFVQTMDALHDGSLVAAPMITEIVDLAHLPERFARLDRETDGGKVIVRP